LLSATCFTTATIHLWLTERVLKHMFDWTYFTCLIVKYLAGSSDIIIVPILILFLDQNLKHGFSIILTAKKKGILSKNNSIYSNM